VSVKKFVICAHEIVVCVVKEVACTFCVFLHELDPC
jgi:hypothetical protein